MEVTMYHKFVLISTLSFLMLMSGFTFANEGKRIFLKADAMNNGYSSETARVKMTLISASDKKTIRQMKMKRLEMANGDRSMIHFLSPGDIRGTALLTWEKKRGSDLQWLYLPTGKRTKRISADNKSGSFVASEFSYEDIGSREIEKYRYKYLRDESFAGKPCFLVTRYPIDRNSGYSKLLCWVRKDNYQTIKIEFYDRKREHLKTLTITQLQKIKGYWRGLHLSMDNVQTGKKTILQYSNLRVKAGLGKSAFTKSALGSR